MGRDSVARGHSRGRIVAGSKASNGKRAGTPGPPGYQRLAKAQAKSEKQRAWQKWWHQSHGGHVESSGKGDKMPKGKGKGKKENNDGFPHIFRIPYGIHPHAYAASNSGVLCTLYYVVLPRTRYLRQALLILMHGLQLCRAGTLRM